MKNDIDDLLSGIFGQRTLRTGNVQPERDTKAGKPQLILETEPTQAQRRAAGEKPKRRASGTKPARGTAPKKKKEPSLSHQREELDALRRRAAEAARELEELETAAPRTSAQLDELIMQQRRELEQLDRNALADIRRISEELDTPQVQQLSDAAQKTAPLPTQPAVRGKTGLEGFDGLAAKLEKTVLGQKEYIRQLVIALKRPYVMGHEGESARSAFFITGPEDTGRHLGLASAVKELAAAGVFVSSEPAWMDLSLYPTSGEEKLFLQDLYMALAAKGDLIVFEEFEQCHPAFLSVLSELVMDGKSPLSGRYVMQNGRLVDAGTALVADAVGTLTPRGKYLVFLSTKPASKLAGRFGAPFVSALGDICTTKPLEEASLVQISEAEFEQFAQRTGSTLGFPVTAAPEVHVLAAHSGGKSSKGAGAVLAFWDRIARALAQYRLEHDECPVSGALTAENDTAMIDFGTGKVPVFSLLPGAYQGELAQVKAELDRIVGLTEIKEYILGLEDNFAVQARRRAAGLKTARVSMHMIFTGNPGTGKTTIARLISRYLKAIGVLSGGQLVEVTRADLVGRYVGHTAPLTMQVIRSALGGVLFIDEAYSLYRGKDDSFGLEAIDTLVKGMEDYRDDLVVILAGYSREMAEFLTSNSGLKSRFPNLIEFPDYTAQELVDIAKIQISSKGYVLDAACDEPLLQYFDAVQKVRARDAGNGRLARNKIEEAILNQSRRCAVQTDADLSLIIPGDFELEDIFG